jgi:hypothetical protein
LCRHSVSRLIPFAPAARQKKTVAGMWTQRLLRKASVSRPHYTGRTIDFAQGCRSGRERKGTAFRNWIKRVPAAGGEGVKTSARALPRDAQGFHRPGPRRPMHGITDCHEVLLSYGRWGEPRRPRLPLSPRTCRSNASNVLQTCFKRASNVLQTCFKRASNVLQTFVNHQVR